MHENEDQMMNGKGYDVSEFGIPWGSNPALRQLAKEYDVNYEDFMSCLECAMTPEEISDELGIETETAGKLRQVFFTHGLVNDLPVD